MCVALGGGARGRHATSTATVAVRDAAVAVRVVTTIVASSAVRVDQRVHHDASERARGERERAARPPPRDDVQERRPCSPRGRRMLLGDGDGAAVASTPPRRRVVQLDDDDMAVTS